MKKKIITSLFAGLLPVFMLVAQEPVNVVGKMKVATNGCMLSKGTVTVLAPGSESNSGLIVNNGALNLQKGVVFKSTDITEGKLANYGTVSLSGSALSDLKVVKTFTASTWYYMSLPFDLNVNMIKDLTSEDLMTLNSSFQIRLYDGETRANTGSTASWKNVAANGIVPANTGFTFMVSKSRINHDVQFSSSGNVTSLYPGEKALSIPYYKYTGSDKPYLTSKSFGWNYVGNSHTTTFKLNKNTTEYVGGVQFYSKEAGTYLTIDLTSTGSDEEIIPPFVGLFVQSTANGQAFTFKSAGISVNSPSMRSFNEQGNSLKLKIQGDKSTFYDVTRITLKDSYIADYSPAEDIVKFFSPQENAPQIWSFSQDKEELSVNKLPENSASVSLGYQVGLKGNYTISLEEGYNNVWLLDKEQNVSVNLKENSYSFAMSGKAASKDRFVLSFYKSPTGITPAECGGVTVYVADGACHVTGTKAGDLICIYDISGRIISEGTSSGASYSSYLPSRGVYIVKVSGSTIATAKIRN